MCGRHLLGVLGGTAEAQTGKSSPAHWDLDTDSRSLALDSGPTSICIFCFKMSILPVTITYTFLYFHARKHYDTSRDVSMPHWVLTLSAITSYSPCDYQLATPPAWKGRTLLYSAPLGPGSPPHLLHLLPPLVPRVPAKQELPPSCARQRLRLREGNTSPRMTKPAIGRARIRIHMSIFISKFMYSRLTL